MAKKKTKKPDAKIIAVMCGINRYVKSYIKSWSDFPIVIWVESVAEESGLSKRETVNALKRGEKNSSTKAGIRVVGPVRGSRKTHTVWREMGKHGLKIILNRVNGNRCRSDG